MKYDTLSIFAWSLADYGALMEELGAPAWRGRQLAEWLWGDGSAGAASSAEGTDSTKNARRGRGGGARPAAESYAEMTNLPVALRERLAEVAPFQRAQILRRQHSSDGTRKYLLGFGSGGDSKDRSADGSGGVSAAKRTGGAGGAGGAGVGRSTDRTGGKTETNVSDAASKNISVEAVGLPETGRRHGSRRGGRLTVCVSSQAGCALGCRFCATGRAGFVRDLLPGEIAEQVRLVGADFSDQAQRVSNVVVMGQGEPFLNYAATLAGLRIINSPQGLGVGARHITLSTAGIIDGIERLATEPEQFTLAVSLHSAVQGTRDRLMPGLRNQPLNRLREALVSYYRTTGRRPSLEYTLMPGVNDSEEELAALVSFAGGDLRAHVNVLPLNKVAAADGGEQSETADLTKTTAATLPPQSTASFVAALRSRGIEASARRSRGNDIAAACGQLRQQQ